MACKSAPESGTEDLSSSEEMKVHPLLLDVILDKIFEVLDLQQLLLCRLVCRAWCGNSRLQSIIRTRSVVNLRTVFLHTSTIMHEMSEYFQNGVSIYSSYNFEDISYHNAFLSKLFFVVGPTIKSIKLLLNLQQLNMEQFRELIYERLPNLEELNIYNLSYKVIYSKPLFTTEEDKQHLKHANLTKLQLQETRIPITEFMTSFLETLPNLREISLKVGICRDWIEQADSWWENSSIATSITKALRASGAFRTLTVFRCGKLNETHMDCLLEMGQSGLQLQVLQLHAPRKESEDAFTQFLHSQRNCLRELIMFEQRSSRYKRKQGEGGHQGFVLRLPEVIPQLELLQLSRHYKSVIVSLHPIDFSLQCPNLKRLIFLGLCHSECGDALGSSSEKHTKIQEVVLWNTVRSAKTAIALGSFSRLTKLHVRHPNSQFLVALWEACDKIQHLTFIFEEGLCVDHGFTGMSEDAIAQWFSQSSAEEDPLQTQNNDLFNCKEWDAAEKENKGIDNLKVLRTLKITVEHCENIERQALCDASVYFSLRKMTQLRYLELYTADWRLGLTECLFFSKKYQKLLKKELEVAVVQLAPLRIMPRE